MAKKKINDKTPTPPIEDRLRMQVKDLIDNTTYDEGLGEEAGVRVALEVLLDLKVGYEMRLQELEQEFEEDPDAD